MATAELAVQVGVAPACRALGFCKNFCVRAVFHSLNRQHKSVSKLDRELRLGSMPFPGGNAPHARAVESVEKKSGPRVASLLMCVSRLAMGSCREAKLLLQIPAIQLR